MEAGQRLCVLASTLTGVREAELSLGARLRGLRTEARSPERRRTAAIAEDIVATGLCKYDNLRYNYFKSTGSECYIG